MTAILPASTAVVGSAEVVGVLEEALVNQPGRPSRVCRLERKPFIYQSSFPLEELSATLEDGTCLALLLKNLSWQALGVSIQKAKPEFLYDAEREIEVYRHVLAGRNLGTAACYGAVSDATAGRSWFLLEKVEGEELYKIGDLSVWEEAARWLARLHTLSPEADSGAATHLLRHDAHYYRRWMQRARELGGAEQSARARSVLQKLAGVHQRVVERLLTLPASLIHGEYYASNILQRRSHPGICPIDWEMAAFGPSLIDLAALVGGNWTDENRTAMLVAYHEACAARGNASLDIDELMISVDYCRLQLAIQWLGWSPGWVPPAQHGHDWLGEALTLAEKLEVV
jgi:hypothetical protein